MYFVYCAVMKQKRRTPNSATLRTRNHKLFITFRKQVCLQQSLDITILLCCNYAIQPALMVYFRDCLMPLEGAIQHKEFIISNFITLDSISTGTTINE